MELKENLIVSSSENTENKNKKDIKKDIKKDSQVNYKSIIIIKQRNITNRKY